MSPESLTSYFAENPTPEHEIADLRAKLQTAEQQLSQSKELHEFFFNRSKDLESYLQAAKRDIEISKESIQASEQRLKQVTAALVKIPCKECCGVKKVRVDGFKLGPCPFCADRDKALSATPSDGCGKGRTDKERLDWLEETNFGMDKVWKDRPSPGYMVRMDLGRYSDHATVREAIDKAMEEAFDKGKEGV